VDEYMLPDAVRCISVGFLIAKTDMALALAPNLGDIEQGREQACGIIRIPVSAVITVSRLELPWTPAADHSGVSVGNVPLPIAGEVHRLAALHRQRRHAAHLIAIRDAAVISRCRV
jgi:hypothetical protein